MDNSGIVASALYQTDPALYAAVDGANSWKQGVKARGARVNKYRRYERGDHDAVITDQMRSMLRLEKDDAGLNALNINYMRIIVDKMAGRLRVSEVLSTTKNKQQDDYINSVLQANDFDANQGIYFRSAIRDGDSYVMVDPESLMWTSEPAYDGFSGIVAIFSPMQEYPLWACKLWSEADTTDLAQQEPSTTVLMRVMVYQNDRITAWKSNAGGQQVEPDNKFEFFELDGGIGLSNEMGWELGIVPVIHFSNLTDNYTQYGESELRVALPIQDVQNRTLHSMATASEFSAYPVDVSYGFKINKEGIQPGAVINLFLKDAGGNAIVDPTPEQIAFLNASKVQQLGITDISQYTNQLSELTKHVSQVTQTPIYGVTAEGNLSGEALKQLETGLIGKIHRFQKENTAAIRQLVELTAQIQNAFATDAGSAPELEGIEVNWASAEILDTSAAITSILDIAERKPNLFSDDFLRQRIGGLLGMQQGQITAEGENVYPEAGELVKAQARVQAVNAGIPLITILRREGWLEEDINQMLADQKRMKEEAGTAASALLETLRIKQQSLNPQDVNA